MKKYLFLAVLIASGLLWLQTARLRSERRERQRLESNQTALLSDVEFYRTKAGESAASVQRLELRAAEFEKLRVADAATIRRLGIRIRRLEATAKTATQTVVELQAALRDTVIYREAPAGPVVADSLRAFRWRDPWVTVEGLVGRDSVACRVESIDTLRQIVHRVPRRFLFIRWGTKAIRQEVISSNPHTRIVYTEYIELK